MSAEFDIKDLFKEENEIKLQWMKFNKIGDWASGTLMNVREMESKLSGQEGKIIKIYEFNAHGGSFHNIDEKKQILPEPIIIKEGEIYSMGGKAIIDKQMRMIKIGQIFGVRFTEEKPPKTKGFNPLKIIKIYAGKMDDTYMGQGLDDMMKDIGLT